VSGESQPDDPWAVNHDRTVAQYTDYGSGDTITGAVLAVLDKLHLIF
jgi:hypothetical protein